MDANPMIDVLMRRASVREYTDNVPSDETVEIIVRAGQQAPFAAQLGSLLLRRDREKNPFHAPLLFTVCADVHRLELVLARRGWKRVTSDAAILVFAIQDAAYMAENLVIAGEALGPRELLPGSGSVRCGPHCGGVRTSEARVPGRPTCDGVSGGGAAAEAAIPALLQPV